MKSDFVVSAKEHNPGAKIQTDEEIHGKDMSVLDKTPTHTFSSRMGQREV